MINKLKSRGEDTPLAVVSYNPVNCGFYVGDMTDGNLLERSAWIAYLTPEGLKTDDEDQAFIKNNNPDIIGFFKQYENNQKNISPYRVAETVINDIGLMRLAWIGLKRINSGQPLYHSVRNIPWNNGFTDYDVGDKIEIMQNSEMHLHFRKDDINKDENTGMIINVSVNNANLWRLKEEQIFKVEEACKILGQVANKRVFKEIFEKCQNISKIRAIDATNGNINTYIYKEIEKLVDIKLESLKREIPVTPNTLVMNPITLSLFRNSPYIETGVLKVFVDIQIPKNVIYLLDSSKVTMADGMFLIKLFKKKIRNGFTNQTAMKGRIQITKHVMPNTTQEILDKSCVKIVIDN